VPTLRPSPTPTPIPTLPPDYPVTALELSEGPLQISEGFILTGDMRLYERETGEITRLALASNQRSIRAPAMSADAAIIAYWDEDEAIGACDPRCASLFVLNRETGETARVPVGAAMGLGSAFHTAVSADGRYVAFSGDGERLTGSYIYDVVGGATTRLAEGGSAVDISADGRYVAIVTSNELIAADTNPGTDVYHIDRREGVITLVSTGAETSVGIFPAHEGGFTHVSLSDDGQVVAFTAGALVAGDFTPCTSYNSREYPDCLHAYTYEVPTDTLTLISTTPEGTPANHLNILPRLSPDGRYVAYTTNATDLDPTAPLACDPGDCSLSVIHDRVTGQNHVVGRPWDGTPITGRSYPLGWAGADTLLLASNYRLLPNAGRQNTYYLVRVPLPDDWTWFRHEEAGFAIGYPADWYVSGDSDVTILTSYEQGERVPNDAAKIDIIVNMPPRFESVEAFVAEQQRSTADHPDVEMRSEWRTVFGDVPGVYVEYTGGPGDATALYTIHAGAGILIAAYYDTSPLPAMLATLREMTP
jgi:hypothetical protein